MGKKAIVKYLTINSLYDLEAVCKSIKVGDLSVKEFEEYIMPKFLQVLNANQGEKLFNNSIEQLIEDCLIGDILYEEVKVDCLNYFSADFCYRHCENKFDFYMEHLEWIDDSELYKDYCIKLAKVKTKEEFDKIDDSLMYIPKKYRSKYIKDLDRLYEEVVEED